MRFLMEFVVDDEKAKAAGFETAAEFSDMCESVLKSYWFDNGVVFNEEAEGYSKRQTRCFETRSLKRQKSKKE